MKLTKLESTLLSDISTALYYLNEAEPSLYSQSMARQYSQAAQKKILDKQKLSLAAEPFIPQPRNDDGTEF